MAGKAGSGKPELSCFAVFCHLPAKFMAIAETMRRSTPPKFVVTHVELLEDLP